MNESILLNKEMKFGAEFLYPKNPNAERFCELLKQKTLTRSDCAILATIGFKIVVAGQEPEIIK